MAGKRSTLKPRVTLFLSSLNPGGAERVAATLANGWVERGYTVRIVTVHDTPAAFALHPDVERDSVRHWAGRSASNPSWLTRASALRAALRCGGPDVVVAFGMRWNVFALMALAGTRVPVIVTEHTDPIAYSEGALWNTLRRGTYPRAAGATIPIESLRDRFPAALRSNFTVIHNPVLPAPRDLAANLESRRFVAMGRLQHEKGFDQLLDAFALIADELADWELYIFGEGEDRAALEQQRARLRLNTRVHFAGHAADAHVALASGAVFVLPSRFEGFGMVLCEALAVGLPAIAFDCPVGPRSILNDGKAGDLVPNGDVAALARTMRTLASDADRRAGLAEAGRNAVSRFGVTAVLETWEQLFNRVLAT
jgi:glycosyltransferase involved in cell wall biosynthesis